jgi:putative ABC transport system permease protein
MTFAEFRNKGNQIGLFLQPLTDIHLYSDFAFDLSPGGDPRYVWLFGAVALFLLLIACINFMNLTTAGAANRAREVGVRKAVGSTKTGLIQQFLTESMLLTAVSFGLALVLARVALPFCREFTGKALATDFLATPGGITALLGLTMTVGLFAGSYPAFFMSGFKPITVLKGMPGNGGGGHAGLRSGLVVLQFAISSALIFATTVVWRQLSFIQNKKTGYDRTSVLVLENTGLLGEREKSLRDLLARDHRVTSISNSAFKPVGPSWNNNSMVYPDDKSGQLTRTLRYEVDEQYIPTLTMKIVQGRNFSKDFGTDSSAVIINQTAARTFGWNDDALGHTLNWSNRKGPNATFRVIGVVEDFHFKSLHEPIAPLFMVLGQTPGLILKTQPGHANDLLASVQKKWAQFGAGEPLEYAFMDDYFQKTYQSEQKTAFLMGLFAGLTIFIACLGLFGLAAFTAERRTKEIGIRKVLGASITSIANLLVGDFLKLVLIAFIVASPIAYYFMQQWLSDFAYRIDMQWWMFAAAGAAAVLVAFLTVGFQSVRAALTNPVKSLRSE